MFQDISALLYRSSISICRPYLIALRYSLDGNTSLSSVNLELTASGVNDAANITRYSDDMTLSADCPTLNDVITITLPELSPGSSSV